MYAYWITVNYREAYGKFACNGILFNHESPIRGGTFGTRKITRAIAHAIVGLEDCLYLANMDALRDWGHARNYVEAQWLMLQQETAEDFVIATGDQHSVRDFVVHSARELGVEIHWTGAGVEERGIVVSAPAKSALKPGRVLVVINSRYFRPAEVEMLLGDPSKANKKLGWKPRTTFAEMVTEMIRSDLQAAKRDALVENVGFTAPTYRE